VAHAYFEARRALGFPMAPEAIRAEVLAACEEEK
jgi:glycyl-tRNA synthetase alpha chain